jgi:hypothetical protein
VLIIASGKLPEARVGRVSHVEKSRPQHLSERRIDEVAWEGFIVMTEAEKRERNRLRSERWRRAHGIRPKTASATAVAGLGVLALDLLSSAGQGTSASGAGLEPAHLAS